MKIDFSHAQSITPKPTQQIVEKLEATFWAEMLKTSKAFDGAFGGDDMGHYRSFMIEARQNNWQNTPYWVWVISS